jgi:hypothetical protein
VLRTVSLHRLLGNPPFGVASDLTAAPREPLAIPARLLDRPIAVPAATPPDSGAHPRRGRQDRATY